MVPWTSVYPSEPIIHYYFLCIFYCWPYHTCTLFPPLCPPLPSPCLQHTIVCVPGWPGQVSESPMLPGPASQAQISSPEPFRKGLLPCAWVEEDRPFPLGHYAWPGPALCQKFFQRINSPLDSLLGEPVRPLHWPHVPLLGPSTNTDWGKLPSSCCNKALALCLGQCGLNCPPSWTQSPLSPLAQCYMGCGLGIWTGDPCLRLRPPSPRSQGTGAAHLPSSSPAAQLQISLTLYEFLCPLSALPAHDISDQLFFKWFFGQNVLQFSCTSRPVRGASGQNFPSPSHPEPRPITHYWGSLWAPFMSPSQCWLCDHPGMSFLRLLLIELWLNYIIVKRMAINQQESLCEKLNVPLKMEICVPSNLISVSYRRGAAWFVVLESNKESQPLYPWKSEM